MSQAADEPRPFAAGEAQQAALEEGLAAADLVISPRLLLPIAPANSVCTETSVAIRGTDIVDLGPTAEVEAHHPSTPRLYLPHHLLLPGLVNAHGHLAMTLLRGLGESQPLEAWLQNIIWPLEARWVDAGFVRDGTMLAAAEMIAAGTTTAADMYFFPDAAAEACRTAGLRLQAAFPITTVANAYSKNVDDCFAKGLALHDRYRDDDLVHTCFGPHSAYALERKHLERIAMLANELDASVHIHLHETAAEVADAKRTAGTTWLRLLDGIGLVNENLQAVHMTAITDDEIPLLAERGVRVVHCPHSNMKLASGVCPVAKLADAGVAVGLGTDGAASNNGLDLFAEARLAALLAKSASEDPTALPAADVLAMATLGGARALGIADAVGSIEVGKRADLVAVDLRHPAMQPLHDVHAQLIHAAAGARVSHTFVNGRCLYADGRWQTLDIDDVQGRAEAWRTRLAG